MNGIVALSRVLDNNTLCCVCVVNTIAVTALILHLVLMLLFLELLIMANNNSVLAREIIMKRKSENRRTLQFNKFTKYYHN